MKDFFEMIGMAPPLYYGIVVDLKGILINKSCKFEMTIFARAMPKIDLSKDLAIVEFQEGIESLCGQGFLVNVFADLF